MNVINYFNGAAVIGFASLVPLYAEEPCSRSWP